MPKPKRKRRPFIDRRHEKHTTFELIHRSQHDPLVADPEAPQRILNPLENPNREKRAVQHPKQEPNEEYHPKTKDNRHLPTDVFASKNEEEEGLLHRELGKPSLIATEDEDLLEILETLDDDFNDDRVVRTEIVSRRRKEAVDSDADEDLFESKEEEDYDSNGEPDELDLIIGQLKDAKCSDKEDEASSQEEGSFDSDFDHEDDDASYVTSCKFTEYSLSSSVLPRKSQLANLDDRFERFAEEYLEEELGCIEEGDLDDFDPESQWNKLNALVQNPKDNQQKQKIDTPESRVIQKTARLSKEKKSNDIDKLEIRAQSGDCQSIISTYSNIYNRPKIIGEKPRTRNTSISSSKKAKERLDSEAGKESIGTNMSEEDPSDVKVEHRRPKHETKEEKRARKQAIKLERSQRRMEKKCNKLAFKEEMIAQNMQKIRTS